MGANNLITSGIQKRLPKQNHLFAIRNRILTLGENDGIQGLSMIAVKFCQRSNLHGMKYIFEKNKKNTKRTNFTRQFCLSIDTFSILIIIIVRMVSVENCNIRNRIEELISKLLWICICCMGAVMTLVLIRLVWSRYQTSPTITTVETINFPIWNVKFPAITLCNINKVYGSAAIDIREKLIDKGLSSDMVTKFLQHLANLISPGFIDTVHLQTYRILEDLNYTTHTLMLELMQPCENMIKHCQWLGKKVPCNSLFRITMSTDGYCCAFNSKALRDSLEIDNLDDEVLEQLNSPIYRVSGYGESVGLSVMLDPEVHEYMSSRSSYYGIRVLIHEAEDLAANADLTTTAQPGEDVSIALVPTVVVSKPEIRLLAPTHRNCLFDDEANLRTTDRYSFKACLTECIVDSTLKICGCIPFYYPHLKLASYAENSKQCSLHNVNCLWANSNALASLRPPWDTYGFNDTTSKGMDCDCLPSCSEEYYRALVTKCYRQESSGLSIPRHVIPEEFQVNNTDIYKYTTLNIYFKDISCIKYRRDIFMTWDSLMASFGGIFGLCLGGSVISLFEMVYFFTFRYGYWIYERVRGRELFKKSQKNELALASSVRADAQETNLTHFGYYE